MNCFFSGAILLLFNVSVLRAQIAEPFGARAAGMAHTAVTLSDGWSLFHNVAGLSGLKKYTAGLAYKNEFGLKMLRKVSAHFTGPLKKGGAGVSLYTLGNEVYRTTSVSAGYAHKIGLVSLGVQLRYLQVSIEGLGGRKNLVVDFGGIAEILPSQLFFGANIVNLNQASMAGELLPVVMKAGLSYRPGQKVMLNAEVEKDLLYKATVKAGLEYTVQNYVNVRTGITTNPFRSFWGVGFQNHRLQCDYALVSHTQLGYSHQLSLLLYLRSIR